MKKGGGIGPVKPWQPVLLEKGAKSYSKLEKDKFIESILRFIVTNEII